MNTVIIKKSKAIMTMNVFRHAHPSNRLHSFIAPFTLLLTIILLCYQTVVISGFTNKYLNNAHVTSPFRFESMSSSSSRLYPTLYRLQSNSNNESELQAEATTCPYSMAFKRYRIPISGGKDNTKSKNIISGLFNGIISSAQKSEFERKYRNNKSVWHDPKSKVSSAESKDDSERILKGKVGIHVSAFVWRTLSNLLQEAIYDLESGGSTMQPYRNEIVIGLPNASIIGLKQLSDIINWMGENETYYLPPSFKFKLNIHANVEDNSPVPTMNFIISSEGVERQIGNICTSTTDTPTTSIPLNEAIIKNRSKAWVNRLLVKMEICPFTKSTTRSGQGLADVGVPVGNIAYHYSNALKHQFPKVLAGTLVMDM